MAVKNSLYANARDRMATFFILQKNDKNVVASWVLSVVRDAAGGRLVTRSSSYCLCKDYH